MQGIKKLLDGLSGNYQKQKILDEGKSYVMAIGGKEEMGFVDFDVEPYSYIEKLVFAYIDRIPMRAYTDKNINLNNFINILCSIYKITPCEQNIKAFIDASMDNNKERRKQISTDFWKKASYNMVDVQKAIAAYKEHPFSGFQLYNHQLSNLDHEAISRIMEIIKFFNFDGNNEVFNCVIKTLSDYPKDHTDVTVTCYRGIWVVMKRQ